MTHPTPNDPPSHDLRAVLESMRREQREAIEALHQQHRAEIEQHRDEMRALTAAMHSQGREIRTLKAQAQGNGVVGVLVHAPKVHWQACRHILSRRPFGGRGTRLGVGLSLALLLLVAPGGSAVTHAGTEGLVNTAYGTGALYGNTGTFSSAFGVNALHSSSTGDHNTASGGRALYSNTTGADNTASGYSALYANTTGFDNTASGSNALSFNTAGAENTASGYNALASNTMGNYNTASGESALFSNSTGHDNTASGHSALYSNTTGINNTAMGYGAGYTDTPANANTTGSFNTFIGYNSGPGVNSQLTNATAIGSNAVVSQSNSIVLGGTGANTQRIGVGTTTPHSAFQIAKGFLQIRPITGEPAAAQCATPDDAGRLVVRTDGNINLYICNGTGGWIGK